MVQTKTDGKNVTITFEYDIMERLKKVLYPSSEYVEYTFDNNGNRLTMIDTRINYRDETFTWNYNSDNTVSRIDYPNDIENYFTYNNLYRLSQMR
jgi:hypothetical protein